MRQKRITQKEILISSISIFIVVSLWITFNVFHAWVTSTVSKNLEMQIIPIEAKFDVDTLNELKDRKKVNPVFELTSQVDASPAATSTEEVPLSTEEPIPTDTLKP